MTYLENVKKSNQKIENINNKYNVIFAGLKKEKKVLKKRILMNEVLIFSFITILYTLTLLILI